MSCLHIPASGAPEIAPPRHLPDKTAGESGFIMSFFTKMKQMAVGTALEKLMDNVLNPRLAGIAKIKKIAWEDKKIHLLLVLNGLDDVDIDVVCNDVKIAEDGSRVSVGGFTSNMPFAENALNQIAARDYPVPERGVARSILKIVKKTLDI